MQLLPYNNPANHSAEATFRTPPWGMLMFPAVLLAICGGAAWALMTGKLPAFFWLGIVILAPFIPLALTTNFLPSLRPTNWVLKLSSERLEVMLRNYRNRHFADDALVIVSIPYADIASVGKEERRISAPGSSPARKTEWTERRLEIRFQKSLPAELRQAIDTERRRKPPVKGFVRSTSYYASPVTIADDRTLRILWNGRNEVIKPPIDRALTALSKHVELHGTAVLDCSNPQQLSQQEFDDLIIDLCASGDRLSAIKLLKRYRDFSTTAAKRLVDELTG